MTSRTAEEIVAEYRTNDEFRKAAVASVLSVFREMKGSHSDESVAVAICERLFGDK